MPQIFKKIAFLITLTFSSMASADYVVVGPVNGIVTGIFGGVTSYSIAWLQNSKGERWAFPSRFKTVDEYNVKKNGTALCLVNVKSTGYGVFSWAANQIKDNPNFYGVESKKSEPPVKYDPDHIVFTCRKQ